MFDLKTKDNVCIELSLHERCYLVAILKIRAKELDETAKYEPDCIRDLIKKLVPEGN